VKVLCLDDRLEWMDHEEMRMGKSRLEVLRHNGRAVGGIIECTWASLCQHQPMFFRSCHHDTTTLPLLDVVLCDPELADADLCNADQLKGKMAIVKRGGNSFTAKLRRVIAAGALGLVIVNTSDELFVAKSSDGGCFVEIPVVTIKAKDSDVLLSSGNSSRLIHALATVALETELMDSMDGKGVPRQVADLPPSGWKPFARQKPYMGYEPDDEGSVYVCGVYGSFSRVDDDDMISVFDGLSGQADTMAREGNVEEALRILNVAIEHFRLTKNEDAVASTLQKMGVIQLHSGDAKAAIVSFNRAVIIVDKLHSNLIPTHHSEPEGSSFEIPVVDRKLDTVRQAVFGRHDALYNWLIAALVENGSISEALLVSEQSKGQALSQLQRSKFRPIVVQWENFSRMIVCENAVVIEFAFTPSPHSHHPQQLVAWVVSQTGCLLGHQIITCHGDDTDRSQIDVGNRLSILLEKLRVVMGVTRGKVKQEWASKEEREVANQKKICREIFDILIRPIKKWLAGVEDVLIVPHLILNDIPWSALMNEDGTYLVESYTIRLAPSVKLLDATRSNKRRRQEDASPRVFIVGNPSPVSKDLEMEELEWAEKEAKEVGIFFSEKVASWHVTSVYGGAATKATVERGLASSDWIHLACHSLIEEQALVLAATDDDDGVTKMGTLIDAFGHCGRLVHGSVVVLSACNTGRGKISSEGVEGMYRSFIAAGCATTLVSLWYIDDQGTFDIMKSLYECLRRGLSLHHSLRYAMLCAAGMGTLEDCPTGLVLKKSVTESDGVSPAFWAGFVVVGLESFLHT